MLPGKVGVYEPLDLVIQTRRVGLVSVRAKTDIENRSTVLELVD